MNVHAKVSDRFRTNVKRIREKKGVSQVRLANMVGISDGYMYQLERGLRAPSLDMIEKFAAALGVDPSALTKESA